MVARSRLGSCRPRIIATWLGAALAAGIAWGIVLQPIDALAAGIALGLAAGITAGIVYPQSWSSSLAFAQLALSGRTPVRLMRFLEDARSRGVLRTVRPVYQFRHARLQDRLATQEPATGQGSGASRPAAGDTAVSVAEPPPASVR
jgi:hypothetical protein